MDSIIADDTSPGLEPNADKGTTVLGMNFGADTDGAEAQVEAQANKLNTPAPDDETAPAFNIIADNERSIGVEANPLSFWGNVSHEVDNGLGNNLAGLVTDYANSQPQSDALYAELEERAQALNEKYGWDSTITDELMGEVSSVDELERKAARIYDYQGYMSSMSSTGMGQQMAAGVLGFVLDPVNLIPGMAVIRGGNAAARLMPRMANTLTRTQAGRTATYAAMGGFEEAIRNYPRLMNDPVYAYDMYVMDVGLGAVFGGGLAAIAPSGRLALNKVTEGVQKAVDKYKTSMDARMTVNALTDAIKVTKNPQAKAAMQDAVDKAAGPEAVKAAKKAANVERAQAQVDESKINITMRDATAKAREAAEEGILDAEAAVKEFADELRQTSPTFAKIADAVVERIKRAAEKADDTQSMGAAKRKETLGTKAGDKVKDLADEHEAVRTALEDIDRAFDLASGVAKGAKDIKAEEMIAAMRSVVKRGVIEKAKMTGVKPRSVTTTEEFADYMLGEKFKKYQKAVNLMDNELNEALKAAGLEERNVLSPTLHRVLRQAGTSIKSLSKDLRKDPELGLRLEVTLDRKFTELVDDFYARVDMQVAYKTVDELPGGALASTNRKTGEIKLRNNLSKEEILAHVRGAIDNPVSEQKRVVLGAQPDLMAKLEGMSLDDLKRFIIQHEFKHTKQDTSKYMSDEGQSIAESLGLGNKDNRYLSDSAVKMEMEANEAAMESFQRSLAAKHAIEKAYNVIRADLMWAKHVSKDRNYAEMSMEPEWALMSREFQESMGGDLEILDDIYNSTFNKTLRNQFGGFTRSYAGELAASRTPLAQWLALNIFELPGGTGGKVARRETAAITMEMYESSAIHPVNVAWDKATRAEARAMGLNMFDSAVMRHSSAAADKNANALGRKVQLEMNARQQGLKSNAEPHVKEYADELEKAYDRLYKIQFENKVEGITGTNKIKAYMRQSWSDARVMKGLEDDQLGREGFDKLIYQALRNRNPEATNADVMRQARATSKRMVDNIMDKSGKDKENIVSDGDYINKRMLHMDLSTKITHNGKEWSILDFMSNDVTSDLNKYAKKASATAAISRASGGKLNSADALRSFITAAGMESRKMGTHVDVGDMTNAFKLMMGEPIKSFDPRARKIRDAVALAGMNGLGESQLAELGLAMNRGTAGLFAAKQVYTRVKGKYNKWNGIILTPEQAKDTALLKEMQSVSTLYEQMHNLARQNVHFDESYTGETTSATINALNKVVDFGTGGKYRPVLQHIQTKHTGYGSIRTMQEQIAMAGLMHDVGRKITGNKTFTSDARLADIGMPIELLRTKRMDGTMEMDSAGNIISLGLESWSEAEKHTLGVALRRHAAQQVQVGFAGETSALMSNPWVAFMMQFRSYPNIAAEKQQMRNALFHDREAAMGLTLNAASSMGARVIRYQSLALALPEEKRERYLNMKYANLGHDTAMYMGGVGTMVNTYDMIKDPTEATPPVASWANNYVKAADGLGNGISSSVIGRIMSAIPLGTIAQMNLIAGIIKELMEADAEEPTRLTTRNRDA